MVSIFRRRVSKAPFYCSSTRGTLNGAIIVTVSNLTKILKKNEFFGPKDTGKTHYILIRPKILNSKGKLTQVKLIFFTFF